MRWIGLLRRAVLAVALASLALAALTLAAPSHAKKLPEASFKLISASGTQTHTFSETTTDQCTGTQSLNLSYRTTKPTKMYVFLKEAHGLHTLISDHSPPDSGLDYLLTPGEMTLSRSVNYEAVRGCRSEPVACPETTFANDVYVLGSHEPSRGISPRYDTNVNLPSGLDPSCEPQPGPEFGPLSTFAERPEGPDRFLAAISRHDLFDEKKKRLSGEDTLELSYQTPTDPDQYRGTTVTGTYRETIAVELKRLKVKKER